MAWRRRDRAAEVLLLGIAAPWSAGLADSRRGRIRGRAMTEAQRTLVETWFGPAFARLHPRLQRLHRRDGTLRGPVEVRVASGIGRLFGERMRRRLGLPEPGPGHELEVRVGHDDQRM